MPRDGRPLKRKIGTQISAKIIALNTLWVSSASKTFNAVHLGSLEARVLCVLADGPMPASEIAKAMAVDRAAISRTLSALTSQALVDRPTGSRPVISLSIEGRKILAAVELINDERMARIFSGFSLEEKESLIAYMDRLSENTDLLHLYSKNIRVSRGSTG